MYHSNLLPPNTINSDSENAMRVRLTQNKLTLAGHNPLSFNQSYISQN